MYRVYQIKEGDTIDSIAQKTGVSARELETINGLKDNYRLMPGEFLVIPNVEVAKGFSVYTVKKGDSIYEIAKSYNIDYHQLLKLNGLNKDDYIYPGEEITVPLRGTKFYITDDNDTIGEVISKLEANPIELLNENPEILVKPDQLMVYTKTI